MVWTCDVAVVGGGLTGLLAAGSLAAAGRRVTVLQAGPVLGGRARSTDHDLFRLNFGPRALYRGPARSALRRLGIRPAGGPPPAKAAWALFDGRLHPGFMTVGGVLSSPLLAYRDRAALTGLLGLVRARPALAAMTAAEWLASGLPSQRSRLAAAALIRVATYLGSPELASADAVAGQLAAARLGVRYLDGGWQSLVDALHRRVSRLGATVLTGRRVAALEAGG
ncbi:MAG TPA: FAD-dependent oxidoreductase, partial [Micromonosporaceae bacterium]|nr:FAD-dependent oxidoreductase [Micromonosporaceae bacterium]